MKRLRVLNIFAIVAALFILSGGQTPGAAAGGSCPHGTFANASGISDGCPAAPSGASNNVSLVQHPDGFTGAFNQSGQMYKARPSWNVAGVDYPVGIPSSVTLKDPAAPGALPAGCTASRTGNTIGGGLVNCSVSGDLTIDGVDFSGTVSGSGTCWVLAVAYTGPPGQHTGTIRNSYFGRGTGCHGNSNSRFAYGVFPGVFGALRFENDVFDYSPVMRGPGFAPISIGNVTNVTFKYCAFLNIPQNPINGNPSGSYTLLMEYNLVYGYTFAGLPNQNHGEVTNLNGAGTNVVAKWYFNTIVKTGQSLAGTGTTDIWFSFSNYATAEARNNTIIDNCDQVSESGRACRGGFNGYLGVNKAMVDIASPVNTFIFTDNFLDYIGVLSGIGFVERSGSCAVPATWSGNTDLVTGSTIDASALVNGAAKGC